MASNVESFKVIDICNNKADSLKEAYHEEIELLKKEIKEKTELLEKNKVASRISEVYNVIDYLRSYHKKLSDTEIDTYLCHCQNMLLGNIDGIVLHFDKE